MKNKMEDERLIELVRKNRVLYDLSHAKYKHLKYKTRLWNKIGAQMMIDGELCKARWNNMRDNYRKSLKKTVIKAKNKKAKFKLYKYHEQLHFLKEFFMERKRKESVSPQGEDLELQGIEYNEVNQTQRTDADLAQHPVDAFLNGIAPTLKSLNQYFLHSAKSEIFATVQKYEMKMMTEQKPSKTASRS